MKKIIKCFVSLILAISVILSLNSAIFAEDVTHSVEYDESKLGDVNADGLRTAADARLLLRCSAELDKPTKLILAYGDYDKDGRITASDARTALRVAASLDNMECILGGHILADHTVAPTCSKKGYTTKKCERCTYTDGSQTNPVPTVAHKLVNTSVAATCTEAGKSSSVCSVCGYVAKTNSVPALGHKFTGWKYGNLSKTRFCTVCGYEDTIKSTADKVIYLTFDDGPGPHTEKLLGYLKEYDVKATFFVTNQSPKYQYVLKKIVDDGHAIGVHTYTHSWSIYASVNNYMTDFNKMHDLIYKETGVDTKIFRFPGGTNNTVSRSYSRGIMTTLASKMTNEGYIYFDWNVDSGDTKGYTASQIAQTTINQIKGNKTSIVLMHDLKRNTVSAISTIIEYGIKNGYEFSVLDENSPKIQFKPAN